MSEWMWVAVLGAAGGGASAWLGRLAAGAVPARRGARRAGAVRRHLGLVALSAATAAAIALMVGGTPDDEGAVRAGWASAVAFFWIGFVTAGWIAAIRDVHVLRQAVCRAATAPAAHPDTVDALAHASPDAVYDTVVALLPRRVAR